jgi:hypothetical protein
MQSRDKRENKKTAATENMIKLFQAGATLQAIGKEYGMTRQAVHYRLTKAGINTSQTKYERFDRTLLEKLYTEERLSLEKIAAIFSTYIDSILKALKFHKIPRRQNIKTGGFKVDFLRSLEIGEKGIFEWKNRGKGAHLHGAAKEIGIKISVKSIGGNHYEVTRIK